ncbi:TFIID-31kDa-domain-containing protein [Corynespora cassiicola Philippines]|uniref:TFIID-31kDa-domain-containing protein n=1 Tax=Corynespora cassiicola Philippines TaxID=1448308 RepID=A0A2T2NP20_CORCC|nr:TFIID-31kDa-domain-containing protein [Corynespora cassiicola Philippines]
MASPAPADMANGISTPPATASNAANPSPPTASSTQPNTQPSQQQTSQLTNGSSGSGPASTPAQPLNPSFPGTSLQDTGSTKRPRDARLIHLLLSNMGVHAYTERVPLQLLDFVYRYTSGVLSDALTYEPPAHAPSGSKKAPKDDDGISLNALRTAVQARAAHQFSAALPKEFMMDVAAERNRIALPRLEREFGMRLPPERYCFTGVGWGVKEAWEEEVEGGEESMDTSGGVGLGGPVGGDTVMGGMDEDEEHDEDEFEEVMGLKDDTNMANA